jgi:hypothetical protein
MAESGLSSLKTVYISVSKKNFGMRFKAVRMASERRMLAVYPGIVADLAQVKTDPNDRDARDRERLEQIKKSSEVWVVGEIGREMEEDISLAKRLGRKVRYFKLAQAGMDLKETGAPESKK